MARSILSDERGIASVEGAMVLPFLILVWSGLVALHHLYEGRLTAQVAAVDAALRGSRAAACGDEAVDLTQRPDTADSAGEAQQQLGAGDAAAGLDALELAGIAPFAWGHTAAAVTVDVPGVPTLFGGSGTTARGGAVVLCNMAPVDGLTDLAAQLVGWEP